MATINLQQKRPGFGGVVPFGNCSALTYPFATKANGAVADSDAAAPLAVGDKIVLGYLPSGFAPLDFLAVVSAPLTSGVKGDLGFEYADGEDDARCPQSATAFASAVPLGEAARLRGESTNRIRRLPKEARLILTVSGAANAKEGAVDFVMFGELNGAL